MNCMEKTVLSSRWKDQRAAGSFGSLRKLLYLRLKREVQWNSFYFQFLSHFLTSASSAIMTETRTVWPLRKLRQEDMEKT